MIALVSALFQGDLAVTTIGEFFDAGGGLMWPILGCSVVVMGLAIERYFSLRAAKVLPQELRDAVEQVHEGSIDAAMAALADRRHAGGRALLAGIARRDMPLHDVERGIEDQLQKEAMRMRGNVRGIQLMAAIAPLLGLLGTVLGIAEAFATVEQSGLGKPENLAAGIKVALYTTIFGLGVAIPATLVAAHLGGRVRLRLLELAEMLGPAVVPLSKQAGADHHAA